VQKLSGKAVSGSAPHENAAVVGAREGHVVIWDMRDGPQDARRRDPVEGAFHKHLHVGEEMLSQRGSSNSTRERTTPGQKAHACTTSQPPSAVFTSGSCSLGFQHQNFTWLASPVVTHTISAQYALHTSGGAQQVE